MSTSLVYAVYLQDECCQILRFTQAGKNEDKMTKYLRRDLTGKNN